MSQDKLDLNEQDILSAFSRGEFASDLSETKKGGLERAADNTLKKDKRINIRIASRDLEALQRRALREGMPYQTLIASILHKYVAGYLEDVSSDKKQEIHKKVWQTRPSRNPI